MMVYFRKRFDAQLGRPPKQCDKKQRQLERFYEKVRNSIEGKFGEGKRCMDTL
jgi:hypothetical protein